MEAPQEHSKSRDQQAGGMSSNYQHPVEIEVSLVSAGLERRCQPELAAPRLTPDHL